MRIKELRILSPAAILGYGFPLSSFADGMDQKPHAIAVDAGSTDPGPYYLGAGASFTGRASVRRDLAHLLEAAVKKKIPLIIGSAGGSGGEPHMQRDREIILDLAREKKISFKMALIHAEVDQVRVKEALNQGRLMPLTGVPPLREEDLEASVRIVGQMGLEPLVAALDTGAEVILAGRAYDPAVFAAPAVRAGFAPGPALHLGKILECGAIAAEPGSGSDSLMGRLYDGYFTVETLNQSRRCTVTSVAAHTLYEKTDPVRLPGPGGILDLQDARYEQIGVNRVKVTGSKFVPAGRYYVKLEGVRKDGYRTISLAGCRDPAMIREIDRVIGSVRERVAESFPQRAGEYLLLFRLYGLNGVMGMLEPIQDFFGHELGIIIEAVAGTQELADSICSLARSTMLHCSYAGRIATAGNLAFPFSPSDFQGGEVYRFSIYHLMEVDDPAELFPVEVIEVDNA